MPAINLRPAFWWIAIALGGIFFITEHSFDTSLSDAFTQSADEMQATASGGNSLRRVAFLMMGGLGILGLCYGAGRRFRIDGMGGPLLCFYGLFCLASILWSHEFSMTARRLATFVCFCGCAFGVARMLRGREIVRLSIYAPLIFLIIGVLAELALGSFRPWAGEYRFSGTQHPNTTGLGIASLCFASLALGFESRRSWYFFAICGVGVFFLILTKSRTSAAGLVFAIALLWTLSTRLSVKLTLIALAGWMLSGIVVLLLLAGVDLAGEVSDAALMGRKEQAESLTGRLPIWTELMPYAAQNWLLGFGYDSFWTPTHIADVSEEVQWGVREAHSAYLDTILSVGVIGLSLLVAALLAHLARAGRLYVRSKHPLAGWLFALLVFGLINAFTESAMAMTLYIPFLMITGMLHLSFFAEDDFQSRDPQASSAFEGDVA
ncbi:O-antigen ligase family protein [Stratiformator vulcanicus]|nr:O-antigen ligase family protein [Stratiformator vulcanicus]